MLGGTSALAGKPISLGQVVESMTGRDIHKNYLVVKIQGNYVFVSDGRNRPIEHPKKKNIRHVKVYKRISEFVASRLQANQRVTDEAVRQVLNDFKAR